MLAPHNVHPNAANPRRTPLHRRPTHKQSIAMQTATDDVRHGCMVQDRDFHIWYTLLTRILCPKA